MSKIYDSEYSIQKDILGELGGDTTKCYDSPYEVQLAILDAIQEGGGGGGVTYTAGQNISIDASNNISALGYVWDSSYGSTATIFRNLPKDGGELAANIATNYGAHAEGCATTATGEGAHAEGAWGTLASGNYSHAEGGATQATGSGAHAEGQYTIASGKYSHAEGFRFKSGDVIVYTTAIGNQSHAEGLGTIATGAAAHTEGALTQALNDAEHAEGVINLSHKVSSNPRDAGNTRHSVGIGYYYIDDPATLYRTNAVEIMGNGDQYIIGIGGYQGTDTKVQNASILTLQDVVNGKADKTYVDASLANKANTSYVDTNFVKLSVLTQAQYNALTTKDASTLYIISDAQ